MDMKAKKVLVLITDGAKLDTFITGIKRAGRKLDADIQLAALSAISAVAEHGNVHYVNSLYMALGKGARHVALTAWLLKFGGVSATEGKGKEFKPFSFDKTKHVDLEMGEAHPWFDEKPSAEPDKVVDVYGLVCALIKKTQKEGVEVKNGHMLVPLRELIENTEKEAEEVEETLAGN